MYTTSCHCGAVVVEVTRKARKLTRCNCSICRRYGALWGYSQRKSIRVRAEPGALERYAWNGETIEYFRCSTCGCVTHYERTAKRKDGSDMAAVNHRNIDDPTLIADVPIRLLDGAKTWKVLEVGPEPHLLRSPAED